MSTQWRAGMGGPIGLDYLVLWRMLDRFHLSEQRYEELEAEVLVMEDEALLTMMGT